MSIIFKKKCVIFKKWIKIIKFFNNSKKFNINFLFFNKKFNKNKTIISYFYYNHTIIQNECNTLRKILDVRINKLDLLKYYDIKNITNKNKIHYIISNIHKIIFSKGYYLKIIQIFNSILRDINFMFFDSCFIKHIGNLNNEIGCNSELYIFKYYYNLMSDFYITEPSNNELILSKQSSFYNPDTVNFSYFNNFSENFLFNFHNDDDYLIFNKKKSIDILNIFFKYFFNNYSFNYIFFNNINYNDSYLKNFFFNIYNKNFNIKILSFTKQYFLLLFTNYKKLHYEQYINFLNNFFSINYFLYKIFFKISFIFKLQLKSLSKKMRKILKNKRRYTLIYTYIKPNKRLNVLLFYIKKFILLSDGKNLQEKLNNTFLSLLLDDKDSWVYQLYSKQQIQCVTNIKYRRN